jgi:hypothetical protein
MGSCMRRSNKHCVYCVIMFLGFYYIRCVMIDGGNNLSSQVEGSLRTRREHLMPRISQAGLPHQPQEERQNPTRTHITPFSWVMIVLLLVLWEQEKGHLMAPRSPLHRNGCHLTVAHLDWAW